MYYTLNKIFYYLSFPTCSHVCRWIHCSVLIIRSEFEIVADELYGKRAPRSWNTHKYLGAFSKKHSHLATHSKLSPRPPCLWPCPPGCRISQRRSSRSSPQSSWRRVLLGSRNPWFWRHQPRSYNNSENQNIFYFTRLPTQQKQF